MPPVDEDFEFGCPLSDDRLAFLQTVDVGLGSPFDEACERVLYREGTDPYVADVMRRSLDWVIALNAEYGGVVSHAGSQMVFGWALTVAHESRVSRSERAILTSPIGTFRELS